MVWRLTLSRYSTSHAKSSPCRLGTALRYPSLRRKLLRCLWNCGEALSKPWSCFRASGGLMMDVWLDQCLEGLGESAGGDVQMPRLNLEARGGGPEGKLGSKPTSRSHAIYSRVESVQGGLRSRCAIRCGARDPRRGDIIGNVSSRLGFSDPSKISRSPIWTNQAHIRRQEGCSSEEGIQGDSRVRVPGSKTPTSASATITFRFESRDNLDIRIALTRRLQNLTRCSR
jgi:hypothetical protein